MSKLTIQDIQRFIKLKLELKELRMGIKDHQRVITDREAEGRNHEANVYRTCIAKARERQETLGKEAIQLRQTINSTKSCRRRYDSYVGMIRMLGRGDIISITLNYPYDGTTVPPSTIVAQMLKLTSQDLLLDLDVTTLTDDERMISRIARGEASITVKEALVLAKHFNTGTDYWLDRQKAYDKYLTMNEKYKMSILR